MKSLRLFVFLMRASGGVMVMMTLAGVLSGLFSVAVIALVSRALHADSPSHQWLALGFAVVVLGKIVSGAFAQLMLTRFSQGTILDLSLMLCSRILGSSLRQMEKQGAARIHAVLTDDVSSVTWAVQSLPRLATNFAIVLGCGAYLAWLSWQMFLWCAGVTLVGALVYKVINDRAWQIIRESRDARSRLFQHFRTLTSGIKELMMHKARREEFMESELRPAADDYRRTNMAATVRHAIAEAWIQLLLYALIGILLFAYPAMSHPSQEAITAYAFAILYMMTPLWAIIGALPPVMRGQVALQKIEELGVSLESPAVDEALTVTQGPGFAVELDQVTFSYETNPTGDTPFALGPLDFRLARGELVFVVGGNGSGKTTFARVLTGLYSPVGGTIRVGGEVVHARNQNAYRENFSAVFSDFHLFEKLLGIAAPDLEAATQRYLQLLQLDHKVRLQGKGFSTVDLSTGQRKRLALLTAYLEDRPFYIFDEWAADQDPQYKHVFYSKLLPELRARGKGVVVITHDDRYFSMGDRVVKLDQGRIVEDAADEPRSRAAL